jgi:hypothetical protein
VSTPLSGGRILLVAVVIVVSLAPAGPRWARGDHRRWDDAKEGPFPPRSYRVPQRFPDA